MEDQGKRIVLFVVIAGAIFIGWQLLFPPAKSTKKPVATSTDAPTVQSPTWSNGSAPNGSGSATPTPPVENPAGSGSGTAAPVAPVAPVAPAPVEVLAPEETIELATERFRLTFSNLGGTIKQVHRLVDPVKSGLVDDDLFVSPLPAVGFASTSFVASTSTYPMSPRAAWKGEKLSETKVRYTYDRDGLLVTKEFELLPTEWMIKATIDVKVAQAATQRLTVSMFGVAPETKGQAPWGKKPWGKCNLGGSVKSTSPGKVAAGAVQRSGNVRFFGSATPFFLFGLSPKPTGADLYECNVYPLAGVKDGVQVDLVYADVKIPAGDTIRKELFGYFGPTYLDKFERADEVAGYKTGLKDTIDFGWFSFISRPLLWLLRHIFALVGNWGIAIILLTVLVKLATLYWTTKSMRSMKAMAALKPEMEALQKKFGDDRQKMQQAQMELFKRNGVNPLSGCLPMLLQMPIWMGLYKMLSHVGELHQAVFIPGYLDDLTQRDPYYIMPVALTGLMFLQSRIQPMTGDSAQQKMLMYGMPLMFGVMGLWFPAGLTVYITTNTILGLAHTLWMKRGADVPVKGLAKSEPAASSSTSSTDKSSSKKKPVIDVESTESTSSDDSDDSDGDDSDDSATGAEASAKTTPAKASKSGGGRSKRRGKRR